MEKKRLEGYKRYLDKTSKESVPKRTLIRRRKTHLSQRVVKSYSISRNDSYSGHEINFNSFKNQQDASDSIVHVDEHSDDEVSRTDNGAVHNISSTSSETDSDCYDELLHTPSDFDTEEQMYSAANDPEPVLKDSEGLKELYFLENIESHIKISKGELIVLILNFAFRHQLSDVGIVDLVELFNLLIGDKLPKSLYSLKNIFGPKCLKAIKHHFFCSNCSNCVNDASGTEKTVLCQYCEAEVNVVDSQKNSFISIDLENQLSQIIKDNDSLQNKLALEPVVQNSESITDITDGRLYKKLQHLNEGHILTYNFCLDGMAMHKNSKGSVWPIFATLNELPIEQRNNVVMLAGLWFGKKEPVFDVFLRPFTEQASRLATKVLNVHVKEKQINVKILPACCCADYVARPCLQNSTQYNGFYGCSWCIHPGFTVDGTVKYCIRDTLLYKERTELDTAELVVEAVKSGKSQFGIKGPSPLITIPYFSVVQGFSLDSMHSIFLGVTKKIVCLWFDSTSSGKDYYIGNPKFVHEVNARMSSTIMPQCVGRVPRSIFERKLYKASEWRNFLLYVCLPVLKDLLPKKYSEHVSYLIGGLFLLLKKSITMQELQKVDRFFLKFVLGAQDLYGEHFMAFNVHSLLHVTQSVLDWGPLWIRSMFVYEGRNAVLRKFSQGPTGIASQMASRYLLDSELFSKETLNLLSPKVLDYVKGLRENSKRKKGINVGDIALVGKSCTKPVSLLNSEYHNASLLYDVLFFSKFILRNQTYGVSKSESLIFTSNNKLGKINAIAANLNSNEVFIYFEEYITSRPLSDNVCFSFICNGSTSKSVINALDIYGKCAEVNSNGKIILTKVIHNFECKT